MENQRHVAKPRLSTAKKTYIDVGLIDVRNPKSHYGIKRDSAKFKEITDPKNIFKDKK